METNQLSRSMKSKSIYSNKDKIDKQLTGESHRWFQTSFLYKGVIIEVSRVTQNTRIWYATGVTRMRHIRADCWTRKKKQEANTTELAEKDENKCDVLFITDTLVNNKDRWIIDSGCSHHISSNRKIFSSYTSVQKRGLHGEFYYEQGNWRRNNQILFSWWMHHYTTKRSSCSQIKVHSHLSQPCIENDSISVLKVIFWKFSKMLKWSFRPIVSVMFTCCKVQRL